MNSPKFTWFIQNEEDNFIASNSYTAEGSYIPGEYLIRNIQIWNNYNGNEDIEDANDLNIVFAFRCYEDNFLLNLIEISVEDEEYKKLNIDMDRGFIPIGMLTGNSNTGQANSSNCKNIKIKIGPVPENIKTDLKTLIFYLENKTSVRDIIDNNTNNNINNDTTPVISAVDKYYVNLKDESILEGAISYTNEKIKSLVGSAHSELDTFDDISKALNNNPSFANDEIQARKKIENKVINIENLTNGLEKPIREYIEEISDVTKEEISDEEINSLIEKIKNNLGL